MKNFRERLTVLILSLVLILLILRNPYAISQGEDENANSILPGLSTENGECIDIISDLPSVTGRGNINFKLLLYEDIYDSATLIKEQDIVCFRYCIVLDHEDTNILQPPPSGEYPYGIWRCVIILDEKRFNPEDHTIVLEIKLPGEINPLNAKYYTQRFDTEEEDIEWVELYKGSRQFYINLDPDPDKRTLNVVLYDAVPLKEYDAGIGFNYLDPNEGGDINPNQWIIEHIGGLIWPIPGKGRCFITNI